MEKVKTKTKTKTKKKFNQLCVWSGTVVGADRTKEFLNFIMSEFGCRAKYECEEKTLPDVVNGKAIIGTGGRIDLFFYIHDDDISKFAIPRLAYGIRWWEDVIGNGGDKIYSDKFLEKYPITW